MGDLLGHVVQVLAIRVLHGVTALIFVQHLANFLGCTLAFIERHRFIGVNDCFMIFSVVIFHSIDFLELNDQMFVLSAESGIDCCDEILAVFVFIRLISSLQITKKLRKATVESFSLRRIVFRMTREGMRLSETADWAIAKLQLTLGQLV